MKSSFPKRVKRHSRKNELAMPMISSKIVFLGKEIFMNIYIYVHIYTYLWRALFQNMLSDLGIGSPTSISGLALNAF